MTEIKTDSVSNPSITVIIALYKGEETMERMITCVLNQTFQDFEIILVDDGSPDRSGEIADQYASVDSRIRVIHKKNEGLAMARNDALAIARGEYSIQFDQDDWVDNSCLKELYVAAKQQDADMVICDYFHNDKYKQTYTTQKPSGLDHFSVLEDILLGKLFGYCWNKLIRTSIYHTFNIKYPKEFYGCEDQYGMCQILKNNIKVVYLAKAFYHYVFADNTLSRHYDNNTFNNDLVCRDMFAKLLADTPFGELAYQMKTSALVSRAFLFGKNTYSSKQFRSKFSIYRNSYSATLTARLFYRLALLNYHFSRNMFAFLYSIKQLYKKILSYK